MKELDKEDINMTQFGLSLQAIAYKLDDFRFHNKHKRRVKSLTDLYQNWIDKVLQLTSSNLPPMEGDQYTDLTYQIFDKLNELEADDFEALKVVLLAVTYKAQNLAFQGGNVAIFLGKTENYYLELMKVDALPPDPDKVIELLEVINSINIELLEEK